MVWSNCILFFPKLGSDLVRVKNLVIILFVDPKALSFFVRFIYFSKPGDIVKVRWRITSRISLCCQGHNDRLFPEPKTGGSPRLSSGEIVKHIVCLEACLEETFSFRELGVSYRMLPSCRWLKLCYGAHVLSHEICKRLGHLFVPEDLLTSGTVCFGFLFRHVNFLMYCS